MSIKAILFDLDNTLVDRQRIFKEMLFDKIKEYHKEATMKELTDIVEQIIKWDDNGKVRRIKAFEKYVEAYGIAVSANEINQYWEDHSGEIVYPFDDAKEVIDYLSGKYRLGIVSNGTSKTQRKKLERLAFIDKFEYTIVSGELGIHKPDKRIFLHVCEEMHVKPEECVFIGDNYACDIEGSNAVGMKSIWKCSKEEKIDNQLCIHDLIELKDIL